MKTKRPTPKQRLALEYGNKIRIAKMIHWHLIHTLKQDIWEGLSTEIQHLHNIYCRKLNIRK